MGKRGPRRLKPDLVAEASAHRPQPRRHCGAGGGSCGRRPRWCCHHRLAGPPIVNATPEEKAATERLAFGPAHLYPSRDEILARFRPVPAQPTIHYVESYIAGTSVRQVPGGWTWKFDPRVFDRSPHLPDLEPLNCRSAFMRGEHGMISPSMAAQIYEGLGKVTQMIAVPQSGHHIMLDQPLALVTGLRAILAEWDQRTRTRFAS